MSNFKRDWEDFDFLSDDLKAERLKYLENSDEYFEKIIKRFPITANRIDWDLIPHRAELIGKNYANKNEKISAFLKDLCLSENWDLSQDIFICFDGYTQGALSMKLKLLLENAYEIFSLPQHTYVIPENCAWCINYSFEDILYFGYSPIVSSVL
jgi:hypothetical protein